MATLLDRTDPEVLAAIEAGRAVLVGLGARPLIEQLDAAIARSADPAAHRDASRASLRAATAGEADPAGRHQG